MPNIVKPAPENPVIGANGKIAEGSVTDVVDGTPICTLTAGAGKQLVGISAFGHTTATASSPSVHFVIGYSDATSEDLLPAAASSMAIVASRAGVLGIGAAAGIPIYVAAANAAKTVTSVELQVGGTGAGTKAGRIFAYEVDI